MKVRESGMPDEAMWSRFFDPEKILRVFGFDRGVHDLVEFGCGYGTFTLPAARLITGTLYTFDIDEDMVKRVKALCREQAITNVRAQVRDFLVKGTGLSSDSVDAVLLFNILHHEDPLALLKEPFRTLKPGGRLAVMHWNYDPATPGGPSMAVRPRPEQCIAWGRGAGFLFDKRERFDLPPYHYGLLFRKPS